MHIELTNTGKRYNRDWIFRGVNLSLKQGKRYAITGPNGSGKSTLVQVIAGAVLHNEGEIRYMVGHQPLAPELAYLHLSLAAPYLDLIEEMTGLEFLNFHASFKAFTQPAVDILKQAGLGKAQHKQIRYYSSGMKQRLKLGQAFFSDTDVLLLDEPSSNLDAEGCKLYQQWISELSNQRTLIISSNDPDEYAVCNEIISIQQYKETV